MCNQNKRRDNKIVIKIETEEELRKIEMVYRTALVRGTKIGLVLGWVFSALVGCLLRFVIFA